MPYVGTRYVADGTGIGTPATLGESNSAQTAVAVVPNDNTIVAFDALYIGVAGDVALVPLSGPAVTFKAVPVGILPVACVRVNATNTTATNILGLTL